MYLNTQTLKDGACLWISALQVPWMGNFILGIQGNNQGDPDPVFTALKEAWGWNIRNGFDLLAKPIVLLVVLMVSLTGSLLKLGIMLCLLPFWFLVTTLVSIKFGLPDYPQTWISPHD